MTDIPAFETVLERARNGGTFVIPEGWTQGRAVFGGLAAGLLCDALQCAVPEGRPLRSMSVSFVAPPAATASHIGSEIFRSGKSVTQAEARLRQNAEVTTVMLASFGADRESLIQLPATSRPMLSAPGECRAFAYVPGMMPEFLQHFEMRWASAHFPFSGQGDGTLSGWVRFARAPSRLTLAHVLGLLDSWPPSVLSLYPRPAPGSSLCWSAEFAPLDPGIFAADGWWCYHASTDSAADGYALSQARLWAPDGSLFAHSRQTVAVFI